MPGRRRPRPARRNDLTSRASSPSWLCSMPDPRAERHLGAAPTPFSSYDTWGRRSVWFYRPLQWHGTIWRSEREAVVAKARWIAAERRAPTCAPTNTSGGLAGERQSTLRVAPRHRYCCCWCTLVSRCTSRATTAFLILVHARPPTAASPRSFIAAGAGALCRGRLARPALRSVRCCSPSMPNRRPPPLGGRASGTSERKDGCLVR